MNRLIVYLQLFDLQQEIDVYNDEGICQLVTQVPTIEVVNKIKELSKVYQVNRVIFVGNEKYNYGFADKLHTHFAENNITVEFVERGLQG